MRKYTERLDIKMTPEDMQLLAAQAYEVGIPLTVYARSIILDVINPMFGGNDNANERMEANQSRKLEE